MRKSAPRIEHQGCDAPSWLTKVCTPEEIGFSHGYWRERDWALSQGLADGILTGDGLRQYIRRQELERAEVYRRHGSGSWEPRSFDYDLAESRRMLRAMEISVRMPSIICPNNQRTIENACSRCYAIPNDQNKNDYKLRRMQTCSEAGPLLIETGQTCQGGWAPSDGYDLRAGASSRRVTHGERAMTMPTWQVRFDGTPTAVKPDAIARQA